MIITYLGKEFFKIQQGDFVLALNPISKDSSWNGKSGRFGANVSLSTTNHPDFNGVETVTYGETVPFVISGPGDYEIKSILVKGVMSDTTLEKKKYINTIYTINFDGIKICFLGPLEASVSADTREEIMNPDIVFVPIGGEGVLEPVAAYTFAASLEPLLIIPMDYGSDKEAGALKKFLKEAGQEELTPVEKLTLKRKDLDGKDADVILLSYE